MAKPVPYSGHPPGAAGPCAAREYRLHLTAIALYLLATLIMYSLLLLGEGQVYYLDMHLPVDGPSVVEALERSFSSWDWLFNTGRAQSFITPMPQYLATYALFSLFGSVELLSKFVYAMVPVVAATSMYYACLRFTGMRAGSVIAGLFFIINPWFVSHYLFGHVWVMLSIAFIPLAFLLVVSAIRTRSVTAMALAALALFLMGIFDQRNVYVMAIAVGAYVLGGLALQVARGGAGRGTLRYVAKHYLLPLTIVSATFLALSAYWVLTLSSMLEGQNPYYPPVELTSAYGFGTSLTGAFAPSYVGWFEVLADGLYDQWFSLGLVLSSLLFASVLLRKNKYAVFFAALALTGIFLAKGGREPFGGLYEFLYLNVPLFSSFRNPTHFVPLVLLGYSFLLCYFVDACARSLSSVGALPRAWRRIVGKGKKKWLAALSLGLALVLVLPAPLLLNPSLSAVEPLPNWHLQTVECPRQIMDLRDFLSEQDDNDRFSVFPPGQMTRYPWATSFAYDPLVYYPPMGVVTPLRTNEDTYANDMIWWAHYMMYGGRTLSSGELFGLLGVRWFVATDATADQWMEGALQSAGRDSGAMLAQQEGLVLAFEEGPYQVYENSAALPLVSASDSVVLAVGDRRVLSSLVDSGASSSWLLGHPVVFTDNLDNASLQQLLPLVSYVVVQADKSDDLTFTALGPRYVLDPTAYLESTDDPSSWIYDAHTPSRYSGDFTNEIRPFAFAEGGPTSTLTFPFSADSAGEYEVWVRSYHGPDMGQIGVLVDGREEFLVDSQQNLSMNGLGNDGMVWELAGTVELGAGEHAIGLVGHGSVAVSQVAVVPAGLVNETRSELMVKLGSPGIVPINIIEGEHMSVQSGSGEVRTGLVSASSGQVVGVASGTVLEITFDTVAAGEYALQLKASPGTPLTLTIDGTPLGAITLPYNASGYSTSSIGPIALSEGPHRLEVHASGDAQIDRVVLSPFSEAASSSLWWLEDLGSALPVEYTVSSGSVTVEVDAPGPFLLVHLSNYNPNWIATAGDETIDPIAAWSYASAYIVEGGRSAPATVSVEYTVQERYELGLWITGLSLIICLAIPIVTYSRKAVRRLRYRSGEGRPGGMER